MQTKKDTEAMVRAWVKTGKALDEYKRRSLENQDYQEDKIGALPDLALKYRTPRMTSGLVEMRRWFEKAWS